MRLSSALYTSRAICTVQCFTVVVHCVMPMTRPVVDVGMEMTWELCCKTRCCVRVIWSSEPSGPCKGMGVSHDLEGL